MKFRHIEIFRMLMMTHSVTRTAEELHTSQPTASRFLAEMEREIGFRLFERTRGKLVPTNEANALYEEVTRSFSGMARIKQVAANIAGFRGDKLRIAAISSLGIGLLAPTLPRFCEKYDGVEVSLGVFSYQEVVDQVATNQCEVGFVAYPVERPGIVEEDLIRAATVCVMPSDHPMADLDVVTPHDIGDTPLISLGHDIPSGKRIDAIFQKAGVERRMAVETQTAVVACAMVREGGGVAIVDPFTAYAWRGPAVEIRPFRPAPPFEFRIILRSDRPASRATRRFIVETRDTLSTLLANAHFEEALAEPAIRYQD